MLMAVDFDDEKIGIYDDEDNNLEYASIKSVKKALSLGIPIMGVVLDESINPIYTLDGLGINLFYKNLPQISSRYSVNVIDGFKFVLLNKGNKTGRTFTIDIKEPLVMVFDMWVPFPKMKYPCGQHICSYLASTILEHANGVGFVFDMSVDSWKINSKSVRDLKEWIDRTLRVKWGYNR